MADETIRLRMRVENQEQIDRLQSELEQLRQAYLALSAVDRQGAPGEQILRDMADRTRDLSSAQRQAAGSSANFGRSLLLAGQGIEDMQYGIGGVLNNIPGLVEAIGGGAGLAGAVSIIAVGANLLYENWDNLMTAFGSSEPKTAAENFRELAEALGRTSQEQARYNQLKAEQNALAEVRDSPVLSAVDRRRNERVGEVISERGQAEVLEPMVAEMTRRRSDIDLGALPAELRDEINAAFAEVVRGRAAGLDDADPRMAPHVQRLRDAEARARQEQANQMLAEALTSEDGLQRLIDKLNDLGVSAEAAADLVAVATGGLTRAEQQRLAEQQQMREREQWLKDQAETEEEYNRLRAMENERFNQAQLARLEEQNRRREEVERRGEAASDRMARRRLDEANKENERIIGGAAERYGAIFGTELDAAMNRGSFRGESDDEIDARLQRQLEARMGSVPEGHRGLAAQRIVEQARERQREREDRMATLRDVFGPLVDPRVRLRAAAAGEFGRMGVAATQGGAMGRAQQQMAARMNRARQQMLQRQWQRFGRYTEAVDRAQPAAPQDPAAALAAAAQQQTQSNQQLAATNRDLAAAIRDGVRV